MSKVTNYFRVCREVWPFDGDSPSETRRAFDAAMEYASERREALY